MEDLKDYKDLGWANAWGGCPPAEVEEARAKGYVLKTYEESRCRTRCQCDEMKWYFRVDSSD